MTLPTDVRDWPYYPIIMPLNKDGEGPECRPYKAVKNTWEVWDRCCFSYGSYDCLPDAINAAIKLTLSDPTGENY